MLERAINSRVVVGLLFVFALALFPATATESKYVWEDTETLNLTVLYPNTAITSLPYADGSEENAEGGAASDSGDASSGPSSSVSSLAPTASRDSAIVDAAEDEADPSGLFGQPSGHEGDIPSREGVGAAFVDSSSDNAKPEGMPTSAITESNGLDSSEG